MASLAAFRGEVFGDVRIFYRSDAGEYRPSRKGVTLRLHLLEELERAVSALREAAEREGLVE